jgi:glycosyltransferase involved in cell wall biosynthesis
MLVIRRPRPGFAVALNEGIRAARAERVGFLFSDDWLAPDALEQAAALPDDIVSTGKRIWAVEPDGEQRLIHAAAMSSAAYEKLTTLEERARYITHFLLLRRSAVLAAGGVDETLGDLSGVDDFDLVWTMLERGASVGFTVAPAYDMRGHGGGRLTMRPVAEQSLSLERMFDKHGVDPFTRDRLRPLHQRWYGRREGDVLAEEGRSAGG